MASPIAVLGIGICPGLTPKQCRVYKDNTCGILILIHRQNVVIVEQVGEADLLVSLLRLSYYMLYNYAERVL